MSKIAKFISNIKSKNHKILCASEEISIRKMDNKIGTTFLNEL